MDEILEICDHVVFNSFSQWGKYKEKAMASGKSLGLRINPEFSTQTGQDIYDPCAPFSRLGITRRNFLVDQLEGISGLHFHTLCEQNSDDLKSTLMAFEEQFGEFLPQMKWLNFGGGHHITREDYDINTLVESIRYMRDKYDLQIYLEPGEAVALNAGVLVASVLDIVENGMEIGILDASAACHMPDVLEMPYRPEIIGGGKPGEKKFTYRFGGPTCLSGDIIGDYSFDEPLNIGDRLEFCDMAIYSMVKNNTFNGINLPSIFLKKGEDCQLIKSFGYEDFKNRLG
jgi:carboxynorspermidine decarboxylase